MPFLTTLWLHAVFVSVETATWLGAGYVGLRALYPVLLGRTVEKTQPKRVFAVTGPCYLIIAYMGFRTVMVAVGG